MESVLNTLLLFALAHTDIAWVAVALSLLGLIIAVLTVVKPAAFWVVKLTKTEKDDAFVKRLYDVIEGTAVDWKPYVALFRRRNPKAADVLDRFAITDKNESGQLSSDT